MPRATLLLSSTERKALFRGLQESLRGHRKRPPRVFPGFVEDLEHRVDSLLDALDDGGLWNPCIIVSPTEDADFPFPALVGCVVTYAASETGYGHTLRMIEDRLLYIKSHNTEPSRTRHPPFLASEGYYGPDWDDVRADAIFRDYERCCRCGMSRGDHREQFGEDLHVHHTDPIREAGSYTEANRLDNLVTVCRSCHADIEGET